MGVDFKPERTDGEGHDLQFVAHQFDHHALLQRRGAAAEHRAAALSHGQELLLQTLIQSVGQRATVDHQADLVHHGGGGWAGGRRGGEDPKGGDVAVERFGGGVI